VTRGHPGSESRGFVSTTLAAAGAWLVEPAEAASEPLVAAPAPPRPVIAVFGLARGCGVTTVARGLAAELARRDGGGAAAVHCDARAAGIPLATPAASQLARTLAEVPGTSTRAVGRLCLVASPAEATLADTARHVAPLVLDAGSNAVGGSPAALADRVLLVGVPAVEPALASVAADCLARIGHAPLLVLNRAPSRNRAEAEAGADDAPEGRRAAGWLALGVQRLPESRMGAQLALGGREPRGELGRAIAALADLCEDAR
jgi:hypothetical protein